MFHESNKLGCIPIVCKMEDMPSWYPIVGTISLSGSKICINILVQVLHWRHKLSLYTQKLWGLAFFQKKINTDEVLSKSLRILCIICLVIERLRHAILEPNLVINCNNHVLDAIMLMILDGRNFNRVFVHIGKLNLSIFEG